MKNKLIELLNSVSFTDDETIANYGGNNQYYKADLKRFNEAKQNAITLFDKLDDIEDEEIIEACACTWSGRMSWVDDHFEYTAGQFYTLELPQAIEAIAETLLALRPH